MNTMISAKFHWPNRQKRPSLVHQPTHAKSKLTLKTPKQLSHRRVVVEHQHCWHCSICSPSQSSSPPFLQVPLWDKLIHNPPPAPEERLVSAEPAPATTHRRHRLPARSCNRTTSTKKIKDTVSVHCYFAKQKFQNRD
ncbi:hypothetical protein T4C_5562 [Trichinella pseudospiralis]|uniref:Uncharacterized protein n=1 Tax=Trichinella pseudospiralis TaxID=6337 RepID=A0A0V1JR13_TRIPS|nr:hypothetical protein T4C_5562 [Trichinella pseudospiralis]